MDENAPQPPEVPQAWAPPAAPPPSPPPVTPPPLISPVAPAPRSKAGRGWMVFALVLLALLIISGLYNVGNYAHSVLHGNNVKYGSRTAGPRLEEVVTEDNDARFKIAVLEINGIISSRVLDQGGYNMVELIKAQLKRAAEDSSVKAVILKVDSPGGEVLASDEINREIKDFQDKNPSKPVVASMGDLAASGGYYVSVPCRWIVANELTLTGSIGVIMHTWNYRELMDKVGVVPQVYKSGKFKDMLSGEREPDKIPPEEREMVQSLIDQTYGRFKSVVDRGRTLAHQKNGDQGRPLSEDWTSYADGRVLSGKEAFKLGFVDELGYFKDAVDRAKKITSTSSANLIEYQQRIDFSDIFRMFGQSGQTEGRAIKVDLGLDTPKLRAGQLYYLSPTFLR